MVTVDTLSRVVTVAEMQCRDLGRRLALILLVVLPLAFYGAMAGHSDQVIIPGGVAMAFSVAGAAIISVLSSRAVDQRLTLAGRNTGRSAPVPGGPIASDRCGHLRVDGSRFSPAASVGDGTRR